MSDLVKRLRAWSPECGCGGDLEKIRKTCPKYGICTANQEAANHIEQLEAENARLREVADDALKALPVLRTMLESAGLAAGVIVAEGMLAHARAALAGKAVSHE